MDDRGPTAGAAAVDGVAVGVEAVSRALIEERAAELPGARVEYEVTSQDTEGNWIWARGLEPALWHDRFRGQVRRRARIVSDWYEVR